jgi:protein-tyrosine phosphatase
MKPHFPNQLVGRCYESAAVTTRFLDLAGADNARDLGGLPTADGVTRRGRILRSDFLVTLGPADRELLIGQLGLRRVIDLRTESEVAQFPGPWEEAGVELVRAAFPLDPAFTARDVDGMVDLYASFLEPPAPALTTAVAALLDPDAHPALIHCAAGKDRTGVLAALALDLAGVEREAIGADFALTRERMPAVIERLEVETGRVRPATLPEVMYGAEPSTILAFLDRVDERFGGPAAWAEGRGIEAAAIARFRAAIVDPGPDQPIG